MYLEYEIKMMISEANIATLLSEKCICKILQKVTLLVPCCNYGYM